MQATGFSPFGQTNSPVHPAMTGSNPFSSQNGFLATDPYATPNSGTNPFPFARSTVMNPFPTGGNINPFTAPTNTLVPNPTGSNPFSSANMNPFPTNLPQSLSLGSPNQPFSTNISNTTMHTLTSTVTASPPFSVPARPASTPLTQTKLFSSPPPLKPHQTGSRNPFGVPKAPSPPPVPRAPTLFELATGVGQPQPLSQSPVQVKPQATGLPTTFTSVASSFVTGGTGGAQASQLTTSSLTSMASPNTATSTPTSLTATTTTGSTFSDSLFGSAGGQPTGRTVLSSQPTGIPLRPQTTGFTAGLKAFKPTSSFGASLLEALPPIPQSAPTTPAFDAASATALYPAGTTGLSGVGAPVGVGLGASLSSVSSPTIGAGTGTSGGPGLGGSFGLATQPTGLIHTGAGMGGPTAFGGGSSVGVGLRPQATGVGIGAVNPFRASVWTPGVGAAAAAGAGSFPAFSAANANASTGLFSQATGAPSLGQSLFMGAQTDTSKQHNGAAQLI